VDQFSFVLYCIIVLLLIVYVTC